MLVVEREQEGSQRGTASNRLFSPNNVPRESQGDQGHSKRSYAPQAEIYFKSLEIFYLAESQCSRS